MNINEFKKISSINILEYRTSITENIYKINFFGNFTVSRCTFNDFRSSALLNISNLSGIFYFLYHKSVFHISKLSQFCSLILPSFIQRTAQLRGFTENCYLVHTGKGVRPSNAPLQPGFVSSLISTCISTCIFTPLYIEDKIAKTL